MIFVRSGGGAVLPSAKGTAATSSSPASSRLNNSLVRSLDSRSLTLGYFSVSAQNRFDKRSPRPADARARCARGREVRRRATQEISAPPSAATDLALVQAPLEPSEFRRGGFTERSSNSAPNAASSLCSCRVMADGVRYRRSAAPAMDPA